MRLVITLLIFLIQFEIFSQSIKVNIPVIEENIRRNQLLGEGIFNSFLSRPLVIQDSMSKIELPYALDLINYKKKNYFLPKLRLLPIHTQTGAGIGNPYPEVSTLLVAKGFQSYVSAGLYTAIGPLSVQFQPEFIHAQNLNYDIGISKSRGTEYLEKFGEGKYQRFLTGQSSIRLNAGAFSLGASTENIWWGPGQFNALLFSNNAFGFEHLTFNTRRPAKTFIGSFEGQLIAGKLLGADEKTRMNARLRNEWRYLNGITFSYQPKWIPGFYVGASRVFQQYIGDRGDTFNDYFPIFEAFQKEKLVEDASNATEYDIKGQDQQLTGFVRFVVPKAKAELYFEYGRRDHALNWREATLNPEHARAYLMGFIKLIDLPSNTLFQVRGEILQQEESVGIIIRDGKHNWGGHGGVQQGFTHYGQMLGPGVGPSSNVQTLEGAWVKGVKKLGVRLERLNRHQDIYVQRFPDPSERGRWVDLSARLLADWQWNNLIVSCNLNFVNSLNHQWQLADGSTKNFPIGKNVFSFHSQVSLIYLPSFRKTSSK
jgi:hypothetical protein